MLSGSLSPEILVNKGREDGSDGEDDDEEDASRNLPMSIHDR